MAKPVLTTVDDDPEVPRAVERNLRRQYGERFLGVRAGSGAAALEALRQEILGRNQVPYQWLDLEVD